MLPANGTWLFAGYIVVFAGAALACFGSIYRARRLADNDTRRGLVALLATCGGWAGSYVGFLLAPTAMTKLSFYLAGLAFGLAAVGAWLYFCSAYTGRSLHRTPAIRRLAVVVFLGIMLLKLTNPLHGLYYTTEVVATPFPHLAVRPELLHWLAMALAYALSFVGYFMLLERFLHVDYDTTPFVVLVTLTGLPAFVDVVGFTSPALVDMPYEPLGVAVFAVGVLFIYLDAFQTIQLASDHENPVVYLDEDRRIQDANQPARELFPALADGTGRPLEAVLPDVAAQLASDASILERELDGTTRYYLVSTSPFTAGKTQIGELLSVTDVTESEQYRQELERKTERLNAFASVVAHDLRNPLNVARGYAENERAQRDSDGLAAIEESLDRMETIIEDMLTLAREGQDIGETESVSLKALVEQCWQEVETADATLTVRGDIEIVADASRLQQLLENLFRNAVDHGGQDVTITVGPLDKEKGFFVADDGSGIPEDVRDEIFEPGVTTTEEGTGFGLAIVNEIVEAHNWEVTVTEGVDGGARFEFTTG